MSASNSTKLKLQSKGAREIYDKLADHIKLQFKEESDEFGFSGKLGEMDSEWVVKTAYK